MWCQYCGKELKDNAKFCSSCGRPVMQAAPGQPPQQNGYGVQPMQPVRPAAHKCSDRALSWIICAIVGVAGLIMAPFTLWDELETPADQIQDTIWEEYSDDIPLGEAFEANFLDATWENNTYNDDPYVTFSGEVMTEYVHLDVKILFRYQEQEETFYTKSAVINDETVSDYGVTVLMQYGFDGDKEALLQNLMADQILGAIFDGYW